MEDMTSLSPNALTTLAVNAFGLTPAFDMPRWFAYKGTEPITMNVPCYLKLKTSFVNDIVNPLLTLFKMTLPMRQGQSLAGKLQSIKPINDLLSMVPLLNEDSGIMSALDQVYLLEVPPGINPAKARNEATRITMRLGKYAAEGEPVRWSIKMSEVVIKNIDITMSRLLVDKGFPERVDLNLEVETLRVASDKMLSSLFHE